jgi:hypothetical protein
MSYIQAITIAVPVEVASVWSPRISDLFVGNNLSLRVAPEDYTPVNEGTQSSFSDYFNGVGYQVSPVRLGFIINVRETRDEFLQTIDAISKWSLSTNYVNFKSVTVYDPLRVEPEDYAQGYTIRTGALWAEDRTATTQKGNIVCTVPPTEYPDGGKYNSGFKLKFLSTKKSIIR